ncbi:CLUMA_CG017580, isoform A [Clunio marinus]|uniref:CLUMA_CG017580, isoform A n=1 Tax=Clunio marinus TaxID=568069 RepID=A0A1J1IY63_9DIPT|nr:CLUMA_CG017580, isoform A [Clunio marinus]
MRIWLLITTFAVILITVSGLIDCPLCTDTPGYTTDSDCTCSGNKVRHERDGSEVGILGFHKIYCCRSKTKKCVETGTP